MPATVFFLWFQMKENGRIWLTKAVQYASFYHASRRRSLDAASDSVRPLTTNGCDESRLMANWLKRSKRGNRTRSGEPVPASRANT